MPRRTAFSAQTLAVLTALTARPSDWRHGYDLARVTGLKSGTLYPILVRLADREIVEACWEEGEPAGRPRRHLYASPATGWRRRRRPWRRRPLRPPGPRRPAGRAAGPGGAAPGR